MFLEVEASEQECNSTRFVHVIMDLKRTLVGCGHDVMEVNCNVPCMVWL